MIKIKAFWSTSNDHECLYISYYAYISGDYISYYMLHVPTPSLHHSPAAYYGVISLSTGSDQN